MFITVASFSVTVAVVSPICTWTFQLSALAPSAVTTPSESVSAYQSLLSTAAPPIETGDSTTGGAILSGNISSLLISESPMYVSASTAWSIFAPDTEPVVVSAGGNSPPSNAGAEIASSRPAPSTRASIYVLVSVSSPVSAP